MELDYHREDRRSILRRRLRQAAALTGIACALIVILFLAVKIKARFPILSAQAKCAAYEPATPIEVLRIRRVAPHFKNFVGVKSDGSEQIESSAPEPACLADFESCFISWKLEHMTDITFASPDSDGYTTCLLHELSSPSNDSVLVRIGVGKTGIHPPFRIWAATPASLFSDPKPLTVGFSVEGNEYGIKPWIAYSQQLQIFSGHMEPGTRTSFRIPFTADGKPGSLRGELRKGRNKDEDYYLHMTIE